MKAADILRRLWRRFRCGFGFHVWSRVWRDDLRRYRKCGVCGMTGWELA